MPLRYEVRRPTFPIVRALRPRHKAQYQRRRRLTIASFVIVIATIIVGLFYSGVFASISQLSDPNHDKMLMHIHPRIEILVDGRQVTIPANVGISSNTWKNHALDRYGMTGMAPLHTHDTSGTIHVESNTVRDYTLGEFFDVWGVPFNETCILDKCSTSGKVSVTINGTSNNEYRNHILKDGEVIRIVSG